MNQRLLHDFIVEEHIKNALKEDIGFGDITTDFLYSKNDLITAHLNTREDGVVCGLDIFKKVFEILSNDVKITTYFVDGDLIKKGDKIASVTGPSRAVLTGERTALNYMQRMSGIATETRKYQNAIKPFKARITDTRKNTPGFRMFEKYAVMTGGARLHRFNLSDCVMIKDNHIKHAGSITKAIELLKINNSHAHKIEVECDTYEQVCEALAAGCDIIMLDNMTIPEMKKCVETINKRAIVEASGNVKINTVNEIASTGVDVISTSAIVAQAHVLDLGLDIS
ncbi:MAG: carboxylating nicotinate-nucleotide diphosphorylase [Clostridium sp.]|nr:carboxylating nicotinate-nucleotide diphosphorylase [Clostridium sp.]